MNNFKEFYRRHERKAAVVVLLASIACFAIGTIRLLDYSLPMLQGRYELAAQNKWQARYEDADDTSNSLFDYQPTLIDRVGETIYSTSLKSTETVVGDRVAAKFNHGLSLYRQNSYSQSVTALEKAYAACHQDDGRLAPEYVELGGLIQLLIGNAYANDGKTGEAVGAYQKSLSHDPNNQTTIYNLEKLQSASGGKGGEDGDKPKPINPANDRI